MQTNAAGMRMLRFVGVSMLDVWARVIFSMERKRCFGECRDIFQNFLNNFIKGPTVCV
jgi:hypothetical protein